VVVVVPAGTEVVVAITVVGVARAGVVVVKVVSTPTGTRMIVAGIAGTGIVVHSGGA
jgi:hypothetical protein